MRLTIIKKDNKVVLDGLAAEVDCSGLPYGFHALQWDTEKGEVEYFREGIYSNEPITDLTPYQPLIDAWSDSVSQANQAQAAQEEQRRLFLESDTYKRSLRDQEINRVAWMVDRHRTQLDAGLATTLTTGQHVSLCLYIQSLRDMPLNGFAWPTKPAIQGV